MILKKIFIPSLAFVFILSSCSDSAGDAREEAVKQMVSAAAEDGISISEYQAGCYVDYVVNNTEIEYTDIGDDGFEPADDDMEFFTTVLAGLAECDIDLFGSDEDSGISLEISDEDSSISIDIEDLLEQESGAPATGPGSMNEPHPIGTTVDIGNDWELTINSSVADGTDLVMAEDDFFDPPELGTVYALVNITLTNTGEEVKSPWEPNIKAVGDEKVELGDCGWATIPDDPDFSKDLFPSGSVTGNICFEMPEGSSLTIYANTTWFDSDNIFFTAID